MSLQHRMIFTWNETICRICAIVNIISDLLMVTVVSVLLLFHSAFFILHVATKREEKLLKKTSQTTSIKHVISIMKRARPIHIIAWMYLRKLVQKEVPYETVSTVFNIILFLRMMYLICTNGVGKSLILKYDNFVMYCVD